MEKCLFVSDLDGTLLNKKSELSKKTTRYIKKIVKQGHYFVINTGRPYQGMLKFKKQLNIECPYICDNGGSIYFDNNPDFPFFTSIPIETIKNFIKDVDDIIYGVMLSSHQKIYFKEKKKIPSWMIHIDNDTTVYEGDLLTLIDTPIVLGTIYIYSENTSKFNEIVKKYENNIAIREWGTHLGLKSYEIFSYESSKGNAQLYLKKYLNIKDGNLISFGDNFNDIDMLEKADIGVAMKNSKRSMLMNTKHITSHPNHRNGVIKYIKKYLKQQKNI